MKKKIKDLTIAQLYEYCKEQESCDDCCSFGHFCFCTLNTPYTLEEETLEQEVEIPDEDEKAKRRVIRLHDYKNYALLLKSFLCKKHGRNERKMYTHRYCQRCPAWDGKNQECCLLRMSKTLRGKRKTTTIMSDENR